MKLTLVNAQLTETPSYPCARHAADEVAASIRYATAEKDPDIRKPVGF